MHVTTTNSIIKFVTNFDQNGFPRAQKSSEDCRSVAVATTHQLHRPEALVERCSGQDAPVAALSGSLAAFLIVTWSHLLHS